MFYQYIRVIAKKFVLVSMLGSCRRLLCQLKPSPLLRTDGYIQHVFRWGVGNKFRSINANRFTPVHHARPKEVTVRADYFDSPHEAVRYDTLNEQWEVFWFEHSKLNAKPFPVKKFGIEQSKTEAESFLRELMESGRFAERPKFTSSVPGVFWDERTQAWFVKDSRKSFGAIKHGFAQAQRLAEQEASKSDLVRMREKLSELIKSNYL